MFHLKNRFPVEMFELESFNIFRSLIIADGESGGDVASGGDEVDHCRWRKQCEGTRMGSLVEF
ncbi:hypothetical protein Hanom_Chr07g00594411 [Helianthus anomalus]